MNKLEALRFAFGSMIESELHELAVLEGAYWTAEDIADQILFEYIKMDYHDSAPKQAIRRHLGCSDDATERRQYGRLMEYVQFYRDIENAHNEEQFNIRIPEYERQDMDSIEAKKAGRQMNAVQFREVTSLHEVRLFLKLINHQIDDKKKVSEERLAELFDEYARYLDDLAKSATTSNSIIENTVALFQIEDRYIIHLMYELAIEAEKRGELPGYVIDRVEMIASIIRTTDFPLYPGQLVDLERRMLMQRHKVISDIFSLSNTEWQNKERFLDISMFETATYIKAHNQKEILKAVHEASIEEKAQYIHDHYWLWELIPSFEWTRKRSTYFRQIHAKLAIDYGKPHIR